MKKSNQASGERGRNVGKLKILALPIILLALVSCANTDTIETSKNGMTFQHTIKIEENTIDEINHINPESTSRNLTGLSFSLKSPGVFKDHYDYGFILSMPSTIDTPQDLTSSIKSLLGITTQDPWVLFKDLSTETEHTIQGYYTKVLGQEGIATLNELNDKYKITVYSKSSEQTGSTTIVILAINSKDPSIDDSEILLISGSATPTEQTKHPGKGEKPEKGEKPGKPGK